MKEDFKRTKLKNSNKIGSNERIKMLDMKKWERKKVV